MTDNFYRAFEDKYRGSRELIKERLRSYLPFIEPLKTAYPDAQSIDLGCGRGEWLELLAEHGFSAKGVDLDDGMLAACRALGLNVETNDAINALELLPANSQAIVSGFHVAEHLEFKVLRALVMQAHRVLKPGGLLILETPNPENLVVGTSSFYNDPTHQRPLPPLLLEFLPQYYGFERVKIIRLQESLSLATSPMIDLLDVIGGVSPDYAMVAQKSAGDESLLVELPAFEKQYGLSLKDLASRYEHQRRQKFETITEATEAVRTDFKQICQNFNAQKQEYVQKIEKTTEAAVVVQAGVEQIRQNFNEQNQEYRQKIEKTMQIAETLRIDVEKIRQELNERIKQATQLVNEARDYAVMLDDKHNAQLLEVQNITKNEASKSDDDQLQIVNDKLNAIVNSRSWRITAPLRSFNYQAQRLRNEGLVCRIKAGVRKFEIFALPRDLYNKVKRRLSRSDLEDSPADIGSLHALTPAASDVYNRLKQTINANKKR